MTRPTCRHIRLAAGLLSGGAEGVDAEREGQGSVMDGEGLRDLEEAVQLEVVIPVLTDLARARPRCLRSS
jgi:hypothetical protein